MSHRALRSTSLSGIVAACLLALAVMPAAAVADDADDPSRDWADVRLDGQVALVTGSTSGLGHEVALRLAAMGATVIVHGRNEQRGREVVDEITAAGGEAAFYRADLASLAETRALAEAVLADFDRLDLLINNAGISGAQGGGERMLTDDGHELVFQVNYLSHFLLTHRLLPRLEESAPARIVSVASVGQRALDFDDLMMDSDYSSGRAYSQSKLAQIMMTYEMAADLEPRGIVISALHPATFMPTRMMGPGRQALSTIDDGATAVMQLAVSPALADATGVYYNSLEHAQANAQAYDDEARARLYRESLRLTGLAN